MGILDSIVGAVANAAFKSGNAAQLQAVWSWVQQQGGLEAIVQKFQQGGLGNILSSWLSNSKNKSVSVADIQSAFSQPELQSLATNLNTDILGASGLLAKILPEVIDKLSPQGEIHPDASTSNQTDLAALVTNIFKR
jgi:uncharacterized protein YidB (DUF937 family)